MAVHADISCATEYCSCRIHFTLSQNEAKRRGGDTATSAQSILHRITNGVIKFIGIGTYLFVILKLSCRCMCACVCSVCVWG